MKPLNACPKAIEIKGRSRRITLHDQPSPTTSKRPRLSVDVANRLRKMIDDRQWVAGQQLPTELKLIDMFGVSRTVIREAISALGAEGLVQPQHGRGVFVAEHLPTRPFRFGDTSIDETTHIRQSMELRLGIETEAATLAAARRTDAELAEIKRALDAINQLNAESVGGAAEDFHFHVKIAEATHNSYLVDFMNFLGTPIIPRVVLRLDFGAERDAFFEELIEHHNAIYDAIEAQDPEAAATAMRIHLSRGLVVNRAV
ncbi:FadR/GntR family transcriptional regulator [Pacificibacter marinus]|uniref:FadR/GntR family transcriptional regulator n=1 Tax=Pacificibacter marinus TaxID=658057 RepID=UPI001C09DA9A|nr:FadR/GntR family transcriptional regulator [Pacificibacter marinus]